MFLLRHFTGHSQYDRNSLSWVITITGKTIYSAKTNAIFRIFLTIAKRSLFSIPSTYAVWVLLLSVVKRVNILTIRTIYSTTFDCTTMLLYEHILVLTFKRNNDYPIALVLNHRMFHLIRQRPLMLARTYATFAELRGNWVDNKTILCSTNVVTFLNDWSSLIRLNQRIATSNRYADLPVHYNNTLWALSRYRFAWCPNNATYRG